MACGGKCGRAAMTPRTTSSGLGIELPGVDSNTVQIMGHAQSDQPVGALAGYVHPRYARSHQDFGVPRELPHCGGWVIERQIPESSYVDAMGCYPLFACRDWSQLQRDVDGLEDEIVSLVVVTDPFGGLDETRLRVCFPDLVIPFKEHYVVDLQKPRNKVVSKHHRYEVRKALRQVSVTRHPDPPAFLDVWMDLHRHLIVKHDIRGVAAFSRAAFADQLATPGIVVLFASDREGPVAALLCYGQGDVAYAHILGCSSAGYRQGALYALIWSAIETFSSSARWLDLMGVPGGQDAGNEGIRQFKRGWTRETRTAWLCGRILHRARYVELVNATATSGARYFPAYRDGEMARLPVANAPGPQGRAAGGAS